MPYSLEHVVTQLQLLMFSALAFTFLMRTGLYPPELKSTNLDSDWFYRRLGRDVIGRLHDVAAEGWESISNTVRLLSRRVTVAIHRHHGPEGYLGRSWPTGQMAFWTTLMLGAYLIAAFW